LVPFEIPFPTSWNGSWLVIRTSRPDWPLPAWSCLHKTSTQRPLPGPRAGTPPLLPRAALGDGLVRRRRVSQALE